MRGFLCKEICLCSEQRLSNFYSVYEKTVRCFDRKTLQKDCNVENDRNRCVGAGDIHVIDAT